MLNIKVEELVTNNTTQSGTKQLGLYTKRKVWDDTPLDENLFHKGKEYKLNWILFY